MNKTKKEQINKKINKLGEKNSFFGGIILKDSEKEIISNFLFLACLKNEDKISEAFETPKEMINETFLSPEEQRSKKIFIEKGKRVLSCFKEPKKEEFTKDINFFINLSKEKGKTVIFDDYVIEKEALKYIIFFLNLKKDMENIKIYLTKKNNEENKNIYAFLFEKQNGSMALLHTKKSTDPESI